MTSVGKARLSPLRFEAPPPPVRKVVAPPVAKEPKAYSGERTPERPPISDTFTETDERFFAKNGPKLVAYKGFDPTKRPVVLVHGMDGRPEHLLAMADRFRKEGRQVYFLCYDDKNTQAQVSGAAFAKELEKVRANHPFACNLDIVAHSFGGIVTRAALSSLENPQWFDAKTPGVKNPRAGFDSIRVRTLDTPWQGYGGNTPQIPVLTKIFMAIVRFFFNLFGFGGAWAMRAESETLAKLHQTTLTDIDLQNIAAHQTGKKDDIRSFDDLSAKDALAVVRHLKLGEEPHDPRIRNWCHMLRTDSRFAKLQAACAGFSVTERPKPEVLAAAAATVMPTVDGTHMSIISDPLVIDRVANELY